MKQYEYRHIRMAYTLLSFFSKAAFDGQLCELLRKMGKDGWELKSSVCEGFLPSHIHFVFGREMEEGR